MSTRLAVLSPASIPTPTRGLLRSSQDPQIRKATSVNLEGAVVILDEAHNIESVCRDAGSLELTVQDLGSLAVELCRLATVGILR